MKRGLIIITVISLVTIVSCSIRNDRVFSASDELHYIILFEDENDFELLFNGVNTAAGQYTLWGDTILLTYNENQFKEFDANDKLTRMILINKGLNRVESIDDRNNFCANIVLDKRKKN